jgi:hypothetical protein
LFPYVRQVPVPLAKKTSKNQITLPRSIVARFPDVRYFDVREEEGRIVLRPVRPDRADGVRKQLAARKIDARTIAAAMRWARKR